MNFSRGAHGEHENGGETEDIAQVDLAVCDGREESVFEVADRQQHTPHAEPPHQSVGTHSVPSGELDSSDDEKREAEQADGGHARAAEELRCGRHSWGRPRRVGIEPRKQRRTKVVRPAATTE